MDFAKTEEQKRIFQLIFARQVMGRPYMAPPGVPADRAAALQAAFMATMTDKAFLADAEKAKFEITPVAGADVAALVADVYRTPPDIAQKAAAMIK
jgi:tripartite-type tricarboxylate transporter receptor subunit TctC